MIRAIGVKDRGEGKMRQLERNGSHSRSGGKGKKKEKNQKKRRKMRDTFPTIMGMMEV